MSLLDTLSSELLHPSHPHPAGITFRPAHQNDLTLLQQNCYPQRTLKSIQAKLFRSLKGQRAGQRLHLIAENDGAPIGTGQLICYARTTEIAELAVMAVWQNKGVGSAMIAILLAVAKQAGHNRIEIGVTVNNERALALYYRLGFRQARDLTRPGHPPAFILQKTI